MVVPLVAPEGRGIVTPEAVVLRFETASVGSRAMAQVVDAAVRGGVLWVAAIVGSIFGGPDNTPRAVLLYLTGFFVIFGYPVLAEVIWDGRTVGKRVVGLRVVTTLGGPVRFRQAAIRSILSLVDFFFPPLGVTATVAVLLSKRDQRLGDMLAGTLVLRERTGATMPVPVSFPPPHGLETYTASLDVGTLTAAQYALVRAFLVRTPTLLPGARERLGRSLANPIAVSMHHTPPPGVNPELFLVCVAAAYQQRLGGPPVPLPPWQAGWGTPTRP